MNKASIKKAKATFVDVNADEATMSSVVHVPRQVLTLQGINIQQDRMLDFSATVGKSDMQGLLAKRMHFVWKRSMEENCVFLLFGKSSKQFVMWCEYNFNGITEVLSINQLDWCKYTFWVEKYICTLLWLWSTFSLWVTWWSNYSGDTERCLTFPEWRGKGALTTSLMHVWNIHLVIDVGLREGRGQTSYRGSLLIGCFYLNCILVDLFNHFSTSSNGCGCCDWKRRHFTAAGEDTAKKGDKCSYLGECGQDAKPQDTIQGTDKKHLMKPQIELKPGWIKTNHHDYSPHF